MKQSFKCYIGIAGEMDRARRVSTGTEISRQIGEIRLQRAVTEYGAVGKGIFTGG